MPAERPRHLASAGDVVATILLVANQKGGVGKTTTVLNLGAALAQSGQKTLMVDLDPQASLTLNLGFDDEENNLANVLGITERGTKEIREIIQPLSDQLDIAPGDILLSRTELGLVVRAAREYQLMEEEADEASLQVGLTKKIEIHWHVL